MYFKQLFESSQNLNWFNNRIKMSRKMISMLSSWVWVLIHEMKRMLEHLVQQTRPQTCDQMIFTFFKKQTKFWIHETCHDVMVSYMETMVKKWDGFYIVSCTMFTNQIILEDVNDNSIIIGIKINGQIVNLLQNFLFRQ